MRLAVTGATGFLGGEICRRARASGWDVTALGRNPVAGQRLEEGGCRFIAAELSATAAMTAAFEGADAVIHSAAMSSPWGRRADFLAANVEGTRHATKAAQAAGVGRFVLVSSTSVYFRFKDQYGIREDMALPPPVNSYAESKGLAEGIARASPVPAVILRPRGIIGPGDRSLLPRLVAAARRGPLPLFRAGEPRVDVTPVESVAEAALAACAPEVPSGTYNISNGEPISVRRLVERVLDAAGQPYRWRPLPVAPLLWGARILEAAHRLIPGQPEPVSTRYGLGLLAYGQTLDISAATAALGYRPACSLDEAIARIGHAWTAGS